MERVWQARDQSLAVSLEMEARRKAQKEAAAAYLALTAHLVPVVQALLLGSTQGVPGHDEVTQSDMHLAVPLGLS